VTDQIFAEKGHIVLRLSPYDPDLNPTELIWADVKQLVASRNTTFKIKDVEQLCRQRFEEIGQKEWHNVCQHVEKL
jgi:transposase